MANYAVRPEVTEHLPGMEIGGTVTPPVMVDIVRWESVEAPFLEDYPSGGVFCMAVECLGISGIAHPGTLWRMTVEDGRENWEKLTQYPVIG